MNNIKDSGERTEFSTGAVRDMHEGKGRCDLLPLDVLAEHFGEPIFERLERFKETGETTFLYDCLRLFRSAFGSTIISEGDCTMFLEVAIHFEEGAKKYGEQNWQKGIEIWSYVDSAARHLLKWLRGDTDERHDRAFVWNIICCIWTVEHGKGVTA